MSRFLEYIDEVCDGSGKKDGTGEKKRKRKGKEENIDEVINPNEKYKKDILQQVNLLKKSIGLKEDNNSKWIGPALYKIEDAAKKIK